MDCWLLRQRFVPFLFISAGLLAALMTPDPVMSLTRESIDSDGHLFSYSIQPSWQSGAIQDDDFRLIVSFFNESEDPFYLRSIKIEKPKDLYVQERSWDDAPRMRPRGENVIRTDRGITVKYGETLRGFIDGKPLKGRIIYANMAVKEDRAVTEPLTVNVHWSQNEGSDTHTINLEKELKINTSKDG